MILSNRIFLLFVVLFGVWNCQTEKADLSRNTDSSVIKKDSIIIIEQPKISEVEQRMIMQGLVDIQTLDSTIMVELKYSTTDNFVKFANESAKGKTRKMRKSLKRKTPRKKLI